MSSIWLVDYEDYWISARLSSDSGNINECCTIAEALKCNSSLFESCPHHMWKVCPKKVPVHSTNGYFQKKNMVDIERNRAVVMAALFDVHDNGGHKSVKIARRSSTTTTIVDWIISRMNTGDESLDLHLFVRSGQPFDFVKSEIMKRAVNDPDINVASLTGSKIGVSRSVTNREAIQHSVEIHTERSGLVSVKDGSMLIYDNIQCPVAIPENADVGIVFFSATCQS